MDVRIDMYPDDVWDEYAHVTLGQDDWQEILDRYHVDYLVLDAGYHAATGCCRASRRGLRSRRASGDLMVFVRRPPTELEAIAYCTARGWRLWLAPLSINRAGGTGSAHPACVSGKHPRTAFARKGRRSAAEHREPPGRAAGSAGPGWNRKETAHGVFSSMNLDSFDDLFVEQLRTCTTRSNG